MFDDELYDWDMFWQNYDDIDMFKEAVVGLIGKLGVDTVEKNYHLNISKLEAMGGQKHLWVSEAAHCHLQSRARLF